jgi:phage tail sheath protein FI
MGFYLSPSVNVIEKDLSITIPAVATSITAMVGQFNWGPCNERVAVTNDRFLEEAFGFSDDTVYESWLNAWNFLQYGNILYIARAVNETTSLNAGLGVNESTTTGTNTGIEDLILNDNDAENYTPTFGADEKLQIFCKFPSTLGNNYQVALADETDFSSANIRTGVTFVSEFEYAPGTNEIAIVVLNADDEIVEKQILSLTVGAKDFAGNNIYVEEWSRRTSKYIYIFDNTSEATGPDSFEATNLSGGVHNAPTDGEVQSGYDLFANPEEFDVNIVIDAANNVTVTQQYIIDNIADTRKDCVAILNSLQADTVNNTSDSAAVTDILTHRNTTLSRSTSYAAYYGNYKYQYDKENDVYRWVSMSGDIAGIYAHTDYVSDPWFAPAGFVRGKMKNVVKFAINPDRGLRDLLYKDQVNPVISPAGDGPTVFGQKTLQSMPSAFDRVDVRRLFIVMEKAISTASKYYLFEKNTAFTRRRIIGSIEPFLRDIQGREGIYEFLVVCDESNNTGEVIDRNELVCDIYIKPTRTAEFLVLNFIATKTGVDFNELIKKA